ncbi:eukaryotic translation initiation factor SUI1 family protein [Coprinopsis cinerea AmutBmut pab1-1]|nr:eukaryotic translation initiation factor SUI1 family protein [Coprinopsis cinerea AmutBmut pab1-1]
MFKKAFGNLKTSAPLRSSDRRKLKQKVVSAYGISPEDGDLLVPDGLESLKFTTHLDEPGILYLSSAGDPLWFTVGKGSEDLIPTTYTLWKKPDLLPFLSTPEPVIPILCGGADLMIPGVIHRPRSLAAGQLVCIRKYSRKDGVPELSVPLAVGSMALPSDQIETGQEKGKAVHVLHVWKDHLWELGSKPDVPPGEPLQSKEEPSESGDAPETVAQSEAPQGEDAPPQPNITPTDAYISYTPSEVTELLQISLVQAIAVLLSKSSSSTFPIPATQFYTNYILPSRPAFPTYVLAPASLGADASKTGEERPHIDPQDINIKASSHKSLTTFLKAADKQGLITTKSPQKHSQQSDLLILSVASKHPLVAAHKPYASVKDIEQKAAKKAERENKDREAEAHREIEVKELLKPHLVTVDLFSAMGADPKQLYMPSEVRSVIFNYVTSNDLVNANDKAYINLDQVLAACVAAKSSGKSKGKGVDAGVSIDFMKRDELVKQVTSKMQSWYEIHVPGKDVVQKKGTLKPIQVVMKIRQGRKASTLITGFEPFLVVNGDDMAEDLRKTCAGATSVSPVAGKPAGSGLEVLVQGKQSSAVLEYLTGKGIPKRWIEVSDLVGKK